jgi:nucleotide-binding universal stress UspA family protein
VAAPGDPVDVIIDAVEAMHAKLVVVGTAGRSRLAQALLGSTAEAVAASVSCDVLLVPPPLPAAQRAREEPLDAEDGAVRRLS